MSYILNTFTDLMVRAMVLPNGCWIWTGAVNSAGYGHARCNKRLDYVHRHAYEFRHGLIICALIVFVLIRYIYRPLLRE